MAKIAYLPIGRKTFDMTAAQEVVDQSVALLRELCPDSNPEQAILTSVEEVQESIRERQPAKPDLVLFQLATFAGSEFVVE
ncbi:MAG: hypothetical protein K0R75_3973, partial [Paenibacillaceae bacterium]|nr:hypothetical protein [Paenibacillaceae bacterium]